MPNERTLLLTVGVELADDDDFRMVGDGVARAVQETVGARKRFTAMRAIVDQDPVAAFHEHVGDDNIGLAGEPGEALP